MKPKLPILFITLFYSFLTFPVFCQIPNDAQEIIILSTNDIHGRINDFGKLAAYVKDMKSNHKNVFVFNAGDLINGNPVVDEAKEKGYPIIDLMKDVPYDISCLGNHEFENGEQILADRVNQSTSILVDANVKVNKNSAFQQPIPYHKFKLADGTSMMVLGLTASSSNPCLIPYIEVLNPIETAMNYKSLRDSANIFVLLSHIGYKQDSILATKMPELDLIVGGHSHTELQGGRLVNHVLITQAGDKLRFIGKTVIHLENHHIIDKSFVLVDVSKLTEVDEKVQHKIDEYNDNDFDEIIGESKGFKSKEELGALKADALAKALDLDIALEHVRNISYSKFPAGKITLGNIYEIDSYDYQTYIYNLSVDDIKNLIKNSLDKESHEPTIFPSGITYTLVKDADGDIKDIMLKKDNKPLDTKKLYKVGINSYIACHFMKNEKVQEISETTSAQALIQYLKTHPKVDYANVKRVYTQK